MDCAVARTLSRVAWRTFGSRLRTRDTVLIDTPAWRATSSIVFRGSWFFMASLHSACPNHSESLTALSRHGMINPQSGLRPRRAPPDRTRNRLYGGAPVNAGRRLRDRGPVRAGDHRDRALRTPACRTQHGSVLPRRQVAPLVHAQPVECVRHVRYLRDDVARRAVRGLR